MKRLSRALSAALLALALLLSACGAGLSGPSYEIDLGSSSLFTQKELERAAVLIQRKFASFRGCELHAIRYAGDYASTQENLEWLNILRQQDEPFVDCALFLSDFHSPKEDLPGEAWNLDYEYLDWQWWLGRTADGSWVLVTWGY